MSTLQKVLLVSQLLLIAGCLFGAGRSLYRLGYIDAQLAIFHSTLPPQQQLQCVDVSEGK